MKEAKSQAKLKISERASPELRVVAIGFNPGPDAEDRLRRLFTILLKLADDDLPFPGADSPQDPSGEERADVLNSGTDGLNDLH